MLADNKQVSQLIPQGIPMIMVDGLVSSDLSETVSTLTIVDDNIFCSNGIFNEPGIVENIAQTAALRSGYQASVNNEKPAVGFIGSVNKLKIYNLPKVNDTLITKITVTTELLNALIIRGETRVGEKMIAEGDMNIFLQ